MRCFEITLNGKKLAVAGAPGALAVNGFLQLIEPSTDVSSFRFSGLIPVAPDHAERGLWAEGKLNLGDELAVRLVDSASPDTWKVQSIEGAGAPAEDSRVACSFCGKRRKDVKHLLAAGRACICDECVSLCVETLSEMTGGAT